MWYCLESFAPLYIFKDKGKEISQPMVAGSTPYQETPTIHPNGILDLSWGPLGILGGPSPPALQGFAIEMQYRTYPGLVPPDHFV